MQVVPPIGAEALRREAREQKATDVPRDAHERRPVSAQGLEQLRLQLRRANLERSLGVARVAASGEGATDGFDPILPQLLPLVILEVLVGVERVAKALKGARLLGRRRQGAHREDVPILDGGPRRCKRTGHRLPWRRRPRAQRTLPLCGHASVRLLLWRYRWQRSGIMVEAAEAAPFESTIL